MEQQNIKKRTPRFIQVEKIKPGQHGYNAYVKVDSANHSEVKRPDGSILKICEAVLGDSTGIVDARIVGDFSALLQKGSIIAIRNGRSEVFKEKQRLEIDRWGKITTENDIKIDSIKSANNLSSILYETKLVPKSDRR